MFAKYYTADQIATILDVDRERVFDWRRAGVIKPALTKGAHQYSREAVVRLALMLALKDVFGEKHGAPARLASTYDEDGGAFVGSLDDSEIPGPAVITIQAPDSDVELRVTIADAIRRRMAEVRA